MSVHKRIHQIVTKYLNESEYSEIKISASKGIILDGYCGCSQRVQFEALKDKKKIVKNLFVKTHTDSPVRNRRLNIKEKFTTESRFYNEVLPLFKNLQMKLPEELKIPFPKCFYASEDCVILEDLFDKEYVSLMDNHMNLDESHISLMIKELAKYHALSFAVKEAFPKEFEKLSEYFKNSPFMHERFVDIINMVWDRSVILIEDEKNLKILTEKEKHLKEKAMSNNFQKKSQRNVICHGDFNYRNGMFKYNQEGQPESMVMIDFQFLQNCPPANDIYFLLFCSTSTQVLEENFNLLLDTYYESFKNFLKLLGYDSNHLYPRTAFDEDMLDYFCNGFLSSMVTLRVFCRPMLEKINDFYEDKFQNNTIFDYSGDDEVEFKLKINMLINTLVRLGLL